MPFEKGNRAQNPEACKENGKLGGRLPRVNPIWRARFYKAMHKKMLPLAQKILMNALRSKEPEANRWAVEKVLKKAVPDAFSIDALDANSLAGVLQEAFKEHGQVKIESDDDDKHEPDEVIPLVRRPGRSRLNAKLRAQRKKFLVNGKGKGSR